VREFTDLYRIITRLRAPHGCEWDREQTAESMRSNLVEEAYEILDAIDRRDDENLCEELGDLFLVTSTIMRIKEEAGDFPPAEVFGGVCDKLIRRHPHVFSDATVDGVDAILAQWDHIKRHEEGKGTDSLLDTIPAALPPLDTANKLQKRAAGVGFDWPDTGGVFDKLDEEIQEIREAMDRRADGEIEAEVGDLLFSVVNLARHLGVHAGVALRGANARFSRRFRRVESGARENGRSMEKMSLADLDELWDQAKADEEDAGNATSRP